MEDRDFWDEERDSSVMSGPSLDTRLELEVSIGAEAAGIQIVRMEGRPDAGGETGRSRQTGNMSCRSVLAR